MPKRIWIISIPRFFTSFTCLSTSKLFIYP
jgi:hypothetical protein